MILITIIYICIYIYLFIYLLGFINQPTSRLALILGTIHGSMSYTTNISPSAELHHVTGDFRGKGGSASVIQPRSYGISSLYCEVPQHGDWDRMGVRTLKNILMIFIYRKIMDIYSFFWDISGIYCVYLNVDEYEMNVLTVKILFWVQAKHPMIIPRDSWFMIMFSMVVSGGL